VPDESGTQRDEVEFDRLARKMYDRLIAPFEPIVRKLTLAPDGMLAVLPFQALLRADRWLAEETEVTYCHSLQFRDGLFSRQYNPNTRHLPPVKKVAVVLESQLRGSGLAPFRHEIEVSAVAKLLTECAPEMGKRYR
jgi:CHAT domain-containing protein